MRNCYFFFFILLLGCSSSDNRILVKNSGQAQGSFYHIKYLSEDGISYKTQIDSILLEVDSSLSIYKEYSLITQLNKGANIKTDAMFNEVYHAAMQVYKKTEGNFDCFNISTCKSLGFL